MRALARGLVIAGLAALAAAGCGEASGPYCAQSIAPDGGLVPGEGTALCRDFLEHPVCDDPGEVARFQLDGAGRTQLVGGTYAICDETLAVVCADRAVTPRCLREPD